MKTIIIAIIVNGAVIFLGIPLTEAETFASNSVTIILIDKLLNFIFAKKS